MTDSVVTTTRNLPVGENTLNMTKNKKGAFVVSKKDYTTWLDGEGVTKEVRELTAAAEDKLFNAGYKFLGDEVIATKEDQQLKIGSGDHTITMTVSGAKVVTNPSSGAKSTIYGSCGLRERRIVPAAIRNSDMMKEIEADIQKAFK